MVREKTGWPGVEMGKLRKNGFDDGFCIRRPTLNILALPTVGLLLNEIQAILESRPRQLDLNVAWMGAISCRSSLEHRIQHRSDLLIHREQYPAAGHRSPQPHRRASPEASDAIIGQNAPESFYSAGSFCALRPGLERVERLRSVRRDDARHGSVGKVRSRALGDASTVFEVLQDIIRAHAESRGTGLLERSADESTIEAQESMLGVDDPNSL